MATQSMILTPDMGTAELTMSHRKLTFTVYAGALQIIVTSGYFKSSVDFHPVGPEVLQATCTDSGTSVPAGYEISLKDTRTPQQRRIDAYRR